MNVQIKNRFIPLSIAELKALPSPRYLIKGLLDEGKLSCVFGASNCGKTFFALDVALSVALDEKQWRDRRTRHGHVVYVAAEASFGIKNRLTAYADAHGINLDQAAFSLITAAPNLNSDSDVALLIEAIGPLEPTLIVVDTLARTFGGENENDASAMSRYVGACDMIREATKAHVMLVHHSGKDTTKGARGSGALLGAVDTEISIAATNNGQKFAHVTKQREGVKGDDLPFDLDVVEIGTDEDGDPVTSCVVRHSYSEVTKAIKGSLTGNARDAMEALTIALDRFGETLAGGGNIPENTRAVTLDRWRTAFDDAQPGKAANTRTQAFKRAKDKLHELGRIGIENEWVWITR